MSDDVFYQLAVLLDTHEKTMNRMARDEMLAFLQMPDRETRPSVLAVAHSYIKAFLSERVARTLEKSSFPLSDVVNGKPLSIYLIIPPNKLRSHRALLILWIGTLLQAITSRKYIPRQRTLFLLDECAQLGSFQFLETVITLCRGYGLQAWSFWQDMGQIKQLYPIGWMTMVNNCAVLQVFGAKNYMVASEFASMIGVETDAIRKLQEHEQVLIIDGGDPIRANRCDYLNNLQFQGLFDANPLYASSRKGI
jgi:type IV secretion system protein VirD4